MKKLNKNVGVVFYFSMMAMFFGSSQASADETAWQVLKANKGGIVYGRDSVTGKKCSFQIDKNAETLYYAFNSPSDPYNSISPGHFKKKWFKNILEENYFDLGPWVGGSKRETKLEVVYDGGNLRILEISNYFKGKLENNCKF